MTAIRRSDGSGWRLLAPSGFPDEATLHTLVEQAPQLLPLAGGPRLTVIGREVLLGGGYADLIAVESTGRLVVIEVKLSKNAEARRAVVAQILAYATYLHGLEPATVERDVLGTHLRSRGFERLLDAAAGNDQEGSIDAEAFSLGLREFLKEGRFRLVLVLDEAPAELVRLAGYLGSVAEKLLIDLVTVAAYDISGSQILVPQRVDPEYRPTDTSAPVAMAPEKGQLIEGVAEFVASIEGARAENRPLLHRLADWALALQRDGLARLATYRGKSGRVSPCCPGYRPRTPVW
jgi:hypothetical protein